MKICETCGENLLITECHKLHYGLKRLHVHCACPQCGYDVIVSQKDKEKPIISKSKNITQKQIYSPFMKGFAPFNMLAAFMIGLGFFFWPFILVGVPLLILAPIVGLYCSFQAKHQRRTV